MQPSKKDVVKKTWGDENDVAKLKKKVERVIKHPTNEIQAAIQRSIELKKEHPNKKGEPVFIPYTPPSNQTTNSQSIGVSPPQFTSTVQQQPVYSTSPDQNNYSRSPTKQYQSSTTMSSPQFTSTAQQQPVYSNSPTIQPITSSPEQNTYSRSPTKQYQSSQASSPQFTLAFQQQPTYSNSPAIQPITSSSSSEQNTYSRSPSKQYQSSTTRSSQFTSTVQNSPTTTQSTYSNSPATTQSTYSNSPATQPITSSQEQNNYSRSSTKQYQLSTTRSPPTFTSTVQQQPTYSNSPTTQPITSSSPEQNNYSRSPSKQYQSSTTQPITSFQEQSNYSQSPSKQYQSPTTTSSQFTLTVQPTYSNSPTTQPFSYESEQRMYTRSPTKQYQVTPHQTTYSNSPLIQSTDQTGNLYNDVTLPLSTSFQQYSDSDGIIPSYTITNQSFVDLSDGIIPSSTDITIPSTDVTIPSTDVTIPSTDVTIPSTDVTIPSNDVTIPSNDVTIPSNDVTIPSTDITISSSDVTIPSAQLSIPSIQQFTPTIASKHNIIMGKEFNEQLLASTIKFSYEEDYVHPSEWFHYKRFEEFLLSRGFLILEYFVQSQFCSFILLQLPAISETVMIYINRTKYPIDVSTSSYKKTEIEKIKVEKHNDDNIDYDNITLDGFEQSHTLDSITDTNIKQKSLVYYMKRQLLRLMYITKNIEIKPCLLMNQYFGFHDIYLMRGRTASKEFYPVVSLEILFSKTFILEQNLPVFYKKFYSIVNQSNVNKIKSLEGSLQKLLERIASVKKSISTYTTLEQDQGRVRTVLQKLKTQEEALQVKRTTKTSVDSVTLSYRMKKIDEEKEEHERKRKECNSISTAIKKEYDGHVFQNEICFYELFDKIRDIEELILYIS